MNLKKLIGQLHLWLGLGSGIIVFIVSITGAIFAFEKEIQDITQPYRFVRVQNMPILKPSILKSKAMMALPNKSLHSIEYLPEGRAVKATFYSASPFYYHLMYIDPYTGKVLHTLDETKNFFFIIKYLHYCLLLPINIGQPIVAISTLVFVIMLITGIVLWWPKNKAAAKQRFWFNWRQGLKWKRKNYDLHNILGFYASSIALIMAITGLVWGFEWFRAAYYNLASGGDTYPQYYSPISDTTKTSNLSLDQKIDWAYAQTHKENPQAQMLEVHIPEKKSDAISCVNSNSSDVYWKNDFVYYDQHTLEEIPVKHIYGRLKDASYADLLQRMNYDIHVGAIFGLKGKILAFGISLLCASLPVTGFLIWWGRKKKAQKEGAKSITLFKLKRFDPAI